MIQNKTLSLITLTCIIISAVVSHGTILINFGFETIPDPGWNTITTYEAGNMGDLNTPVPMVDSTSTLSSITLTTTVPFHFYNTAGYSGGSVGDFTANSVAGTLYTAYSQTTYKTPTILIEGLDPELAYTFEIFAARDGTLDDRSARYTFTGENTAFADLNPSSNASETALIENIIPSISGSITFVTTKAPSSTSDFFYIGAMKITAVPEPAACAIFSGMAVLMFFVFRKRKHA